MKKGQRLDQNQVFSGCKLEREMPRTAEANSSCLTRLLGVGVCCKGYAITDEMTSAQARSLVR